MAYTCHPSRQIVAFGPSVGAYQGRDIPAWIRHGDGKESDYVGVAGLMPDLGALGPDQSVIAPGLIYQERVSTG